MGNTVSWIWAKLFRNRKKRVLMVGLESSGKTTLLYRLKLGKVVDTSVTHCFNLETFERDGEVIDIFDIGGRWKIRSHLFSKTDGLIFVIDASNVAPYNDANHSLLDTISQEDIRNRGGIPLLIFMNKMDDAQMKMESNPLLPNAINLKAIKQSSPNTHVRVQPCSAVTGEGLSQGMDWLCNAMNGYFRNEESSVEMGEEVVV